MDKLDYRILSTLKKNGRETAPDTSKATHLSVSVALDRIKKMKESGIIKGYTVRTDAKTLGNDVTALMEISLEHLRFHNSFTGVIVDHPNILDCYYLIGDYDLMLKISCVSSDELGRIRRAIKSIPGMSTTRTHFALKETKNMYSAMPEEKKKWSQYRVSVNILL